jgi:hypothetical protein
MNMEGKVLWKTGRSPDFNKGSMILADGLILATDGASPLPDRARPVGFKPRRPPRCWEEGTRSEGIAARIGGRSELG